MNSKANYVLGDFDGFNALLYAVHVTIADVLTSAEHLVLNFKMPFDPIAHDNIQKTCPLRFTALH